MAFHGTQLVDDVLKQFPRVDAVMKGGGVFADVAVKIRITAFRIETEQGSVDFESVIVTAEPVEKPERVLVLAIEGDVAETVAAQLPQQAGQLAPARAVFPLRTRMAAEALDEGRTLRRSETVRPVTRGTVITSVGTGELLSHDQGGMIVELLAQGFDLALQLPVAQAYRTHGREIASGEPEAEEMQVFRISLPGEEPFVSHGTQRRHGVVEPVVFLPPDLAERLLKRTAVAALQEDQPFRRDGGQMRVLTTLLQHLQRFAGLTVVMRVVGEDGDGASPVVAGIDHVAHRYTPLRFNTCRAAYTALSVSWRCHA